MKNKYAVPLIAVSAFLGTGFITGGTLALFSDSPDLPTIMTGTMSVDLEGKSVWKRDGEILDTKEYAAQPGESFQVEQPFKATANGTNLEAELLVAWENGTANAVSGTYTVVDDANTVIVPESPIGEATELSAVEMEIIGGHSERNFKVVMDITVGDIPFDYFDPSKAIGYYGERNTTSARQTIDELGVLEIVVKQKERA